MGRKVHGPKELAPQGKQAVQALVSYVESLSYFRENHPLIYGMRMVTGIDNDDAIVRLGYRGDPSGPLRARRQQHWGLIQPHS